MTDKIIFKSNFLEVYFGLFAPCLLYYDNGYVHNNRIVISLIFFKLYFNIGGSTKQDSEADIYGFYFKSDPDAFIFCWNNYYKSILMPWTQVVVKKQLIENVGMLDSKFDGAQDFDFYDKMFENWKYDFSNENFPYTSSQYRKFSSEILETAFGISKDIIETL